MALPEPTTLEPLEKKIPQRYTHNELVLDFLKKCLDKDPMMRWTCEQLLRHPIFENFLFTVPQSDHEDFEKARRTQQEYVEQSQDAEDVSNVTDTTISKKSKKK